MNTLTGKMAMELSTANFKWEKRNPKSLFLRNECLPLLLIKLNSHYSQFKKVLTVSFRIEKGGKIHFGVYLHVIKCI